MSYRIVFCPVCNEKVRLAPPPDRPEAPLPDLVCVDVDEPCVTDTCPFTGKGGPVMALRLRDSGVELPPRGRPAVVTGYCPACDAVRDLDLLDEVYAVCTGCGTNYEWRVVKTRIGPLAITTPAAPPAAD